MSHVAGDDVWVDWDGTGLLWPGEVLQANSSGYFLVRVHVDVEHDFGRASARIDPEQIVAVRPSRITRREENK